MLDGRGDGAIMIVKRPSLRERDDREVTPRGQAQKMRACMLNLTKRSSTVLGSQTSYLLSCLLGRADLCTVPGGREGSPRRSWHGEYGKHKRIAWLEFGFRYFLSNRTNGMHCTPPTPAVRKSDRNGVWHETR